MVWIWTWQFRILSVYRAIIFMIILTRVENRIKKPLTDKVLPSNPTIPSIEGFFPIVESLYDNEDGIDKPLAVPETPGPLAEVIPPSYGGTTENFKWPSGGLGELKSGPIVYAEPVAGNRYAEAPTRLPSAAAPKLSSKQRTRVIVYQGPYPKNGQLSKILPVIQSGYRYRYIFKDGQMVTSRPGPGPGQFTGDMTQRSNRAGTAQQYSRCCQPYNQCCLGRIQWYVCTVFCRCCLARTKTQVTPPIQRCADSLSAWSTCSTSCSYGVQTRIMTDHTCRRTEQRRSCFIRDCMTPAPEPVPCQYFMSQWSRCTVTCGRGVQIRRTNQNPTCTVKQERRFCFMPSCPTTPRPTQCTRHSTSWTSCSVTCGRGRQTRQTNWNKDCKIITQRTFCFMPRCMVAPVTRPAAFVATTKKMCLPYITRWSACSKTCGRGYQTRRTNQNPTCTVTIETTLCHIRSCTQTKVCRPTYTGTKIMTYRGCTALLYTWTPCQYCGGNSAVSPCCKAMSSRKQYNFMCSNGQQLRRQMTVYTHCICTC